MATPLLDAMTDFKIIDKDGIWVKNVCIFPMADGSTNNFFSPTTATKVLENDWVKLQLAAGVLQKCENPLADLESPEEVKLKRKGKEDN